MAESVSKVNKFPNASFEPESLLKIAVHPDTTSGWEGDVLLIATFEEDFQAEDDTLKISNPKLQSLDDPLKGAIEDAVKFGGFEGKQGQKSQIVRVGAPQGPKYVGLLGLGKAAKSAPSSDWGPSAYQKAGAAVVAASKSQKAVSTAVAFAGEASPEDIGKLALGILLATFQPTRFKTKAPKEPLKLEGVTLLLPATAEGVEEALQRANAVASGNLLARHLVEAPPNVCTPTYLAEAAKHLAAKYPETMKLTILEKEDCEALGMGCFLGVSECSAEPPKFIHLTYTPPGEVVKKVALVGKGITFDSGGYNLKVHGMIEMMKIDMGGAAAILGAANILGALQSPGVEVHFITASCENMVDGRGTRPGDILTSASGKTVEVNNTDAEGRLTLADAVWYAQTKAEVKTVVDIATLTGSQIVALGWEIGAVMSAQDELVESLLAASRSAGEKLWRLPLESNYFSSLESSSADMKNSGSRWGGSILAGTFINQFIQEGTEWAHIDCAGPVWDEKLGLPTGYGAATLAAWVEALDKGADSSS